MWILKYYKVNTHEHSQALKYASCPHRDNDDTTMQPSSTPRFELVLQVHDELLFEVRKCCMHEVYIY